MIEVFVSTNKVSAIVDLFRKRLSSIYDERELKNIIQIVFEHVMGWDKITFRQKLNSGLSESELLHFNSILKRLQNNEPIQHILGKTDFFGIEFSVNESVLIPRPETEELIDLIVNEQKNNEFRILDIGTGTGCIAIALKKHLQKATVVAIDVSEKAIETAVSNAFKNSVEVEFINMDVFSEKIFDVGKFDIIVSNPPYITESEKVEMRTNVLEHEPHLALFVTSNPLEFYQRICELSKSMLNPNGVVYFELNENYAKEYATLFSGYTSDFTLIEDLNKKKRFGKLNF